MVEQGKDWKDRVPQEAAVQDAAAVTQAAEQPAEPEQQEQLASKAGDVLEQEPQATVPIAGLGVDIVEIARMQEILKRTPSFRERVFTQAERDYCESKHNPAVHYATHFAAKEAVLKALGTGFAKGIGFTDVEVTHDPKGKPLAVLHGRAKEIAAQNDIIDIPISLSRTHTTAVANAIATSEATKPALEEQRVSPKQQIASAFKELRGMLDDIDDDMDGDMGGEGQAQ